MKPSLIISQLKDYSKCPTSKFGDWEGRLVTNEEECVVSIQAIIDYLDELHEQGKLCDCHKCPNKK
jgi:hypothetical protein